MTANSKAVQARVEGATAARVGGQRAHDLRIGPQPDYVDPERTPLNSTLIEPLTGIQIREICEERRGQRQTKRALKSDAAVGVSGIITFGREAQLIFAKLTRQEQDAAYREIAEALAERLQTTLTGLVAHRDEAADHAHFQCPGVTLDGRPVSKIAKRQCLRDLQTIAAEIIARHAPGIERGTPRWVRIEQGETYADTVHKSAAEMRLQLPADLAAARELVESEQNQAQEIERRRIQLQADLASLQTEIADAQARAAKNEELARKARIKAADDDAAAAKRLEAYERRRATAQTEAEALETKQAALERQLSKCEQDSAELAAELQKKREDLAAQEETLQVGEEILSQIQEEISSGEAKQAQIKALDAELATRTEELHQLKRRYDVKLKEQEQGTARDFALIGSAWDLAREGEFETPVTVEDLVQEGLSPNEAAASHREMRRGLGTRPLTKGWRLYKQVLSGSGGTLLFRPSADLDAVFYELRDICRRVRSERRDRLDHAQALEKAEQKSREALQRAAAELEAREASLKLRQQTAGLEEERLGQLKAELEEREQAAQRQGEEARREQAALDQRRAGELEFLNAFQKGEVTRVGLDEKSGELTFWRLNALPEEKKQALSAAWRQVGPELRSMLQNVSERRRELGAREEALKVREQASAQERARLDRRREWRVRLVLGVRRRRTEISAREASCAENEAKLEGREATALRQEKRMRRELETAQAALDQRRAAETAFMAAFQSGEVARVGLNDKGRLIFWFAQNLPEDRKAPLREAWGQVSPEFRTLLQVVSEERRKALEQGRETGAEEIKAAVAAGVEALHRGEISEVKREDETWSLRYHSGLQEERRGFLARILEPVLKIVAPILRRITDFLKGQDLQVRAYAEAVRRPSIDWSSGPSM